MPDWPAHPDDVFIAHDASPPVRAERHRGGARWTSKSSEVRTEIDEQRLVVKISCPKAPIARVALRWRSTFAPGALVLGDAWERGYGDLQWRGVQPERIMPWYFAAHDPSRGVTSAIGVQTQANALCCWTADQHGMTLWLDLRSGGMPSEPGDRIIEAASIVRAESEPGESPMHLIRRLCLLMCPTPRLAPSAQSVCGSNNWYYAYGQNFNSAQVLRDATLLAELAGGHANRPYCVIDAGWTAGGACPGGPWTHGLPDKFPDMPGLAADIKRIGVRPGIWMRPTALSQVDDPRRLRAGPQRSAEKALDLTLPENLQLIADDVSRMRSWGYELIKHDFSCWDAFGRWGFDFGIDMTDPGWSWHDRTLTNAEVILRLYRTLRAAAGDAVLIGCNTFGHVGAGLFELQRTGDDTSGRVWERTRRMGINTLAFRLPQHGTFFQADADCVAHTNRTPWEKDRQFLDLVAQSGTPLFVSVDPTKIEPHVKDTMREAMQVALSGGRRDVEPIDWLDTTCPRRWRIDGREVSFDWSDPGVAWPGKV